MPPLERGSQARNLQHFWTNSLICKRKTACQYLYWPSEAYSREAPYSRRLQVCQVVLPSRNPCLRTPILQSCEVCCICVSYVRLRQRGYREGYDGFVHPRGLKHGPWS